MKLTTLLCALAGAGVATQALGVVQVRQRIGNGAFGLTSTLTCSNTVNLVLDGNPATATPDPVAAGSVVLVHVFGDPATDDLGQIELSIPPGSGMPREVRVLIAGQQASNWLDSPVQGDPPPGLRNWAGITVNEANLAGLTDRVVLRADLDGSMAIACSTSPLIEVGSVVRLVARQRINGDIRGLRNHVPVGAGDFDANKNDLVFNAIGLVQAREGINADIVAGDVAFGDLNGLGSEDRKANIFTVRAGPFIPTINNPNAFDQSDGILGTIWAKRGVVKNVFSTGKIGPDPDVGGPATSILAGNGVWVVRGAVDEFAPFPNRPAHELRNPPSDPNVLLADSERYAKHQQDFNVEIQSNLSMPPTSQRTIRDGAIKLVATPGSLLRSLRAETLFWRASEPLVGGEEVFSLNGAGQFQRGVLLGGDLGTNGSAVTIDIATVMEQCDIVFLNGAKSSVRIGWSARGSIVAKERYFNLSIGMSELEQDHPLRAYPRGYRGVSSGPVHMGEQLPAASADDNFRQTWLLRPVLLGQPLPSIYTFDGGSADSVLRARYIEGVNIWAMRMDHRPFGASPHVSANRPRLELQARPEEPEWENSQAPVVDIGAQGIGFTLEQGIANGVVWSGRLDYGAVPGFLPSPINNREDHYAWVNLRVGSMGPGADVWVREDGLRLLPNAIGSNLLSHLPVYADMQGEVRMRQIGPSTVVYVGDAMGKGSVRPPVISSLAASAHQPLIGEESPRTIQLFLGETALAAQGGVVVDGIGTEFDERADVRGQIISNARTDVSSPPPFSHLDAFTSIGAYPSPQFTGAVLLLSSNTEPSIFSFPDRRLPYYQRLAEAFSEGFPVAPGVDFNGGAVGLAAYRIHPEDSLPFNPSTWLTAPPPSSNDIEVLDVQAWARFTAGHRVRTRFYGPVAIVCPTAAPGNQGIKVERDLNPDPFIYQWADVTDQFYAIQYRDPNGPATHTSWPNLDRDIFLRPAVDDSNNAFANYAGVYRVSRATNATFDGVPAARIVSQLTNVLSDLGDDTRVQPFVHYFRFASPGVGAGAGFVPCLRADFAGPNQSIGPDGQLTADDIIVFLNWYFASDDRADVAGPNQSDVPDGEFTADDIIVYLNWYFQSTPCPFGGAVPDRVLLETPGALCGQGEVASKEEEQQGLAGRMSAPMLGRPGAGSPTSAPASAPSGQTQAQRIANMQAMIDAEPNPQRRALLQAALQLLQSAPMPVPSPTPAPSPAPGTDDR